MTIIEKIRLITLMGFMGLVGLVTSCTSEEVEVPKESRSVPVELKSYSAWYQENVGTRAWTPPTGFSVFEENNDQSIGVNFTQDTKDPIFGYFFKSAGKWRFKVISPTDISEEDAIKAEDYYLYGYTPHTTGISCTVTDKADGKAKFSEGAKLTIQNLPSVTAHDVCVLVGAKNGSSTDNDGGLQLGNFKYHAELMGDKAEADKHNYVFLLFDHLYAALSIEMRVHSSYNALRTIKLKKLSLKTSADGVETNEYTDIEITLTNRTDGLTPIDKDAEDNDKITFTQKGDPISDGEIFSSTKGETLGTDITTHQGHFMPLGITTLELTSTYDVYDKNVTPQHPDGNLIRQNCTATNKLVLKDLFSGQSATGRGQRYIVEMTIHPTYLYMLSEPDLDNPTVKVE
jgi:hypothetical protein